MRDTLLVVDDEPRIRRVVQMALEERGYRVLTSGSAEEAAGVLDDERVDMVVADLQLPGRSGLELLADVRSSRPDVPVVLVTAYGTVETAVEAMKLGAFDYVVKPLRMDELEAQVTRALSLRRSAREIGYLKEVTAVDPEGIVARSPGMRRVMELVDQVAAAPTTVLVTGETGVGKEVVARAIHDRSPRRDRLFVAVNCAAIPADLLEAELFGVVRGAFTGAVKDRPGKMEVADGGTLFLDEIGDMPPAMQPKLLRALQEGTLQRLGSNVNRRVDVRIVTATHQDLPTLLESGRFREDLYYRIAVFPIHVPPLRERPEDVGPLVEQALARFGARIGRSVRLDERVLPRLETYPWPGNVRELMNVVERAVLLAGDGVVDDVPLPRGGPATAGPATPRAPGQEAEDAGEPVSLADAVAAAERAAIRDALARTGDNKAAAARLLDVSVRTLWNKLEKLGLR